MEEIYPFTLIILGQIEISIKYIEHIRRFYIYLQKFGICHRFGAIGEEQCSKGEVDCSWDKSLIITVLLETNFSV